MGQNRITEIAHQDLALKECIVNPLAIPVGGTGKKIVCARWDDKVTKLAQLGGEPFTRCTDTFDTIQEIILIDQGSRNSSLSEAIKIVVIADLVQRSNNFRTSNGQAKTHPGQRVTFRQGAGNDYIRFFPNQVNTIAFGKIRISFIHHQQASTSVGQCRNFFDSPMQTERRIGIGQKKQLASVTFRKILNLTAFSYCESFYLCTLNLCQSCIIRIGGMQISDFFTLTDTGSNQVVEQLIRTIGHDYPVNRIAVEISSCLTTATTGRIRVLAQIITGRRLDCLDHLRRRRIRVLIGIELDPFRLVRRLKAWHVTCHIRDIFAEIRHC